MDQLYRSKIIKAGALVADTKTLLANWDDACSMSKNLDRFRRENIFGKTSRSRVEDILAIFRQRYLVSPSITQALATLVKEQFSAEGLVRIFYFHAAQADALLHDVVSEVLFSLQTSGKTEVAIQDLLTPLARWVAEGKTAGHWSEPTLVRVAQGLMATLRDFGVLQGKVQKRLAPLYLPVQAFAYISFLLHEKQPSGERLLSHPEWRLFFFHKRSSVFSSKRIRPTSWSITPLDRSSVLPFPPGPSRSMLMLSLKERIELLERVSKGDRSCYCEEPLRLRSGQAPATKQSLFQAKIASLRSQ